MSALSSDELERFIAWANDVARWGALPEPSGPDIIVEHARDIPDRTFLALISQLSTAVYWPWSDRHRPHWVMVSDLIGALRMLGYRAHHGSSEMPLSLVKAKAERLIARGLMDGCTCGCRGDFELTTAGISFVIGAPV